MPFASLCLLPGIMLDHGRRAANAPHGVEFLFVVNGPHDACERMAYVGHRDAVLPVECFFEGQYGEDEVDIVL